MADEVYWSYKASSPTPTLVDAIMVNAVPFKTTEQQWYGLSPGMRREIFRQSKIIKNNLK